MKPWYRSKTFWINTLAGTIAALTYLADVQWMPREVVAVITGLALPVINIVLRWVNTDPITSPTKKLDKFRPKTMDVIDHKGGSARP